MKSLMKLAALLSVVATNSAFGEGKAAMQTQEIKYTADGVEYVGYLAKPEKISGKLPAILVVHEWWGQTDYPRRRAELLADLGYVALAVDMYGGRKIANHPKQAGEYMQAVMSDAKVVYGRFNAALKALQGDKDVDANRIAAIGYCFGGSVVLDMAKQGLPLKGVVSFHGGLKTPTPPKPGIVKAKILVLNGADDKMIDAAQVKGFQDEMKAANISFELVNYPGAMHGFTNPEATALGKVNSIPVAYNEAADHASWKKMQEFFKANL